MLASNVWRTHPSSFNPTLMQILIFLWFCTVQLLYFLSCPVFVCTKRFKFILLLCHLAMGWAFPLRRGFTPKYHTQPLSSLEMFTSVTRGRDELSFHADTTHHAVEEGKIESVSLYVNNSFKINKFLHVSLHGVHVMSSCRYDPFVFVIFGDHWFQGSYWKGRSVYSLPEVQELVYWTLRGILSYGIWLWSTIGVTVYCHMSYVHYCTILYRCSSVYVNTVCVKRCIAGPWRFYMSCVLERETAAFSKKMDQAGKWNGLYACATAPLSFSC